MNKKLITIIVVVLCIIALGTGVYFAWQKTRTILTPPSSSPQGFTNGQSVSINDGSTGSVPGGATTSKLSVISDKTVYGYWVFNSNSTSTQSGVFYIGRDGIIYKVKADGADETLTSTPIENFQSLKSSFDGKRVIIKSRDLSGESKFVIYNSEENIFESLPNKIAAADFSPDGKKVAYFSANIKDPNKSDLITKNLIDLKQKLETLISLYQEDFDLNWISQNKITLVPRPSAFYSASIWAVDVSKKTLSRLAGEKEGLAINWSPDGKIGLQFSSSFEGRNRILNLISDQGEIRANFEFITLPEKCFVSDPKIYCAIPQSIPDNATLPDDYLENAVYFIDSLYQIDVNQNSFERILDGSASVIDAVNLKSTDGKLFFINKYDSKLYVLEL
ncbi:hypothetical protein A3J77_01755 [Candidatus Wolfebacteria bacterium RBG_13_41_7]|uniref:Dipeptidylpeptidase IV N-terminal domain-containing protein n=1 Tax=Candidatus Wolfebacteria bacterium RBG_13_41_7 TaxID=1802554 RepID=A0A1F8DMP1_9BACT|nr:MAG: hypothetical protein A3J77_01755 [Candidatus Wolfebacteria bacterium RBG_13_41_7]